MKAKLPNVKLTEETRLGKGGFGEVFRAAHPDEHVAVKTLASIRYFSDTVCVTLEMVVWACMT